MLINEIAIIIYFDSDNDRRMKCKQRLKNHLLVSPYIKIYSIKNIFKK